ncbi:MULTISPECIES: phage tail protein [Comamonas]|uniref:phage tail protein n=1 Tax=Comamonas TaxID=283 RepID=UPI0006B94949|nr:MULTISPECIES: phage tail protein [Comamonas]
MRKPIDLRQHLTAALPDLQRDPERLVMTVTGGQIQATAVPKLAWQYAYTLRMIFLDWTPHSDVIMAPLLVWVHQHQNELLANPDKKGIRFEAEYLNTESMDLVVYLDLTERVIAKELAETSGAMELVHFDDTPPMFMPKPEHWKIFIQGEEVAQWSYPQNKPPGSVAPAP